MRSHCIPSIGIVALGFAAAAQEPAALGPDERILHVLSRCTPGPTAELVDEVRRRGIEDWLREQLAGSAQEPAAYEALLATLETLPLAFEELREQYDPVLPRDATRSERREVRRLQAIPTREMLQWIVLRSVYSRNGVRETSCDFFRNHFAVSIDKGAVRVLVVDWEREVILRHALGQFPRMLAASAKHPAMLFYLDNCLSRRPATQAELAGIARRVLRQTGSEERVEEAVDLARQRGLNENYARELLELHTLGVDRGYTQQDVISVAQCLTGWTIGRRGDLRGRFEFQRAMHCPGDKSLLGQKIPARPRDPEGEGEQVVLRLAAHPDTARFLSWKLCRWLVSDQPDEAMVARIARVLENTRGDLASAFAAIVHDPGFFQRAVYRTKLKRPWELVVSALRVTGAEVTAAEGVLRALEAMGEPLYRCADPTGYYDQAEAWQDPGAMATRWAFADSLAQGKVPGVRLPAVLWSSLPEDHPERWAEILVQRVLPVCGVGPATARALQREVAAARAKDARPAPRELGAQLLTILLGAPEFQRQ